MIKKIFTVFFFLLILASEIFSQSLGDVVINEIMYAPTTGNSEEWFEIYNKSTSTFNLKNWKWKDSAGVFRTITTQNINLAPNSYAVVCQDSISVKNFYTGFSGLIFQTTWNALNNGQDSVVLVDSLGTRIDFVAYRSGWGGSTGNKSLERINPAGPSNQQTNWGTSIATIGATPNLINSITPKNNDLRLNLITFTPTNPLIGQTLSIITNIKNIGLLQSTAYTVSVYEDYNRDSIPNTNELLSTQNSMFNLNSGDSVNFSFQDLLDSIGVRQYIAKVNYTIDEDTLNNKKVSSILVVGQPSNDSVVINEIMYAPSPNTGKEWFEIYNKSANPVDIKKWKWKDSTSTIRIITSQSVLLPANSFAVVCEDSAAFRSFYPAVTGLVLQSIGWSALNNTGGESVILFDSNLSQKDSITFNSTWGGGSNNTSLERIFVNGPSNQQSNFGTCIDPIGATPNRVNSLTPKNNDLSLHKILFNRSVISLNDTTTITATVKNRGLLSAMNYTVTFYKDYNRDSIPSKNELFATLNSSGTLNSGDSLNFNTVYTADSSGLRFIIAKVNYSIDQDTNNNKRLGSINVLGGAPLVVINEIMYDPPTNEPEWFELFNNSDSTFNLKNWKFADSSATLTITANDFFLQPDSFVVIAKDNTIFTNHPSLSQSRVLFISSMSLSNSGDAINIFRDNNQLMDKVDFSPSWGGTKASLERISLTAFSNDANNWATSIECEKSTPARINSLANILPAAFNDLIVNEIMAAPVTNEAEWIELYNPTNKTFNITNWKMFETGGDYSITDTCSAIIKPGMYVVFASDSTIFNRFTYLRIPDSTIKIFIRDNEKDSSTLGLNNDADLVKITDLLNTITDSVYYLDDWHNPNIGDVTGRSLEKINSSLPANSRQSWNSCVLNIGGTPGRKNSIFSLVPNSNSSITILPNPFSPDNDGFEDYTLMSYKLKSTVSQIRIKIFDIKGRLVRTLANNQTSGPDGIITFDGLDDDKQKLRIGIYIVFLEALDNQNGVVEQIKTTVVVAAKL